MNMHPSLLLLLVATAVVLVHLFFWLPKAPSKTRSFFKTAPVAILCLAGLLGGINPIAVIALIACAVGDYYLSLEGEKKFMSGLRAFLAGHLFYTAYFAAQTASGAFFTQNFLVTALILGALAVLVMVRVWPYLEEMRLPVVVYTIVICAMALTARAAEPGNMVLAGIALFVVSDVILAHDNFTPLTNTVRRRAMPYLVWILYFSGQSMIVYGLIGGKFPFG